MKKYEKEYMALREQELQQEDPIERIEVREKALFRHDCNVFCQVQEAGLMRPVYDTCPILCLTPSTWCYL